MQQRLSNGDALRFSISSVPSSSSQGSGQEDCESLGDVYVWGEIWCDNTDGVNSLCSRTDALLPKSLESNFVLDVHQIACGVNHASLVTRQGEVFTWGEESGGRLGFGSHVDVSKPQPVEFLSTSSVNNVACGEYHTCAVSVSGDLFTWGDGTHNIGLLGHGTDVSHWIPKRVTGPLEGIEVISVACGTWHSALVTSSGKLFTFGIGSFGVLGHGNRENALYPREVQTLTLNGLKSIKVACGVWHSAAIIEIPGQSSSNAACRKLFTWGDGDKFRLGHGDKNVRLFPTLVKSLIDFNFQQIACGHTITIGLTTSGRVFTMGSTAHGQLGNHQTDGKLPFPVQNRLANEIVEDIACGSYHVAALTSRSEVFTWGKGENGRLGHGDTEDRKTPTLVESLKDRHVKSISCGSKFTASVCIHKWVSGADQSICSGCRQAFGFTRKRHNCYNCGLVHCHACSSNKILRAILAPVPGKPHRVCDSCFAKVKAAESAGNQTIIRKEIATSTRERVELRPSKYLFLPSKQPAKGIQAKHRKTDSLSQLKDISGSGTASSTLHGALNHIVTSQTTTVNSRPVSPSIGRPSSPLSEFSKSSVESLKKTNEFLNKEVLNLQGQVKNLKQKCEIHDAECVKQEKKAKESISLAAKETIKCNQVVQIVKSLAEQLKDISKAIPSETKDLSLMQEQAETLLRTYSAMKNSRSDHQPISKGSSFPDDNSAENVSRFSQIHLLKSKSMKEGEFDEKFEPGVYVTLVRNPDGTKVFRRIRFSKKRFGEHQAEEWWKLNQERVMKRYSTPSTDAPSSIS